MVLWCGERHVLETQPSRSYPNPIFLLFVLCASDRRVILIHINGADDSSKSIWVKLPYAQYFFFEVLPIPGLKLLVGSSLR